MSLTEFMADPSLGTPSWIEDDFDITSTLNANNQFHSPSPSPSPFGTHNNFSNNFNDHHFDNNRSHSYNFNRDRDHLNNGIHNQTHARNSNLDSVGSWRNSSALSKGNNINYKDSYIVVFDNIPRNCTRQLLKELFESRYTKMEKCHVLLDPSDPNHEKKLAFIFLYNNQDLQKVLKWNGINIERMRFIIEPATANEFQSVLQFNNDLNYDEDLEDERIENEEKSQRQPRRNINDPIIKQNTINHAKPKVNPFGNAKPVLVPEIPIISDNTKEIAKALDNQTISNNNSRRGSINTRSRSHSQTRKVNPFGKAKPVAVPEIPVISDSTADIAKTLDVPVKKSVTTNHPKVNPFGNAKPVDTLAKQMEIEKKLAKAAINETTFDMTLIHEKKDNDNNNKDGEIISEEEADESSNNNNNNTAHHVKILKRKDSIDSIISPSPSTNATNTNTPISKGYKTTSGFERRIARELSEEEYEREMKKRNEFLNGKERTSRNSSVRRSMNNNRYNNNSNRPNSRTRFNNLGYSHYNNSSNSSNNQDYSRSNSIEENKDIDKVDLEKVENTVDNTKKKASGELVNEKKVNEEEETSEQKEKESEKVGIEVQESSKEEVVTNVDATTANTTATTPTDDDDDESKESKELVEEDTNIRTETNNTTRGGFGRGRGRGYRGRGYRGFSNRSRGSRGGRGGRFNDNGWGYVRSGSGNTNNSRGGRSRGEYNGRGGYRNLVYHKPVETGDKTDKIDNCRNGRW